MLSADGYSQKGIQRNVRMGIHCVLLKYTEVDEVAGERRMEAAVLGSTERAARRANA